MQMDRNEIIERIKANKPELVHFELPDMQIFAEAADLAAEFTAQVEASGGKLISCGHSEIGYHLNSLYPDAVTRCSMSTDFQPADNLDIATVKEARSLENLDLLVLEGAFGVAENGAVWLSDQLLVKRLLPFITKNLALVVENSALVGNMHDAYAKIGPYSEGYGVFVAGPSKTADIEQSLVIGAQGPLSLTVFLVELYEVGRRKSEGSPSFP